MVIVAHFSSLNNQKMTENKQEMGSFFHSSNCIKTTNKIPEYAKNYKKEYLFIRGINKEFKYFVENN